MDRLEETLELSESPQWSLLQTALKLSLLARWSFCSIYVSPDGLRSNSRAHLSSLDWIELEAASRIEQSKSNETSEINPTLNSDPISVLEMISPSVIIAADVVFAPELISPLCSTLKKALQLGQERLDSSEDTTEYLVNSKALVASTIRNEETYGKFLAALSEFSIWFALSNPKSPLSDLIWYPLFNSKLSSIYPTIASLDLQFHTVDLLSPSFDFHQLPLFPTAHQPAVDGKVELLQITLQWTFHFRLLYSTNLQVCSWRQTRSFHPSAVVHISSTAAALKDCKVEETLKNPQPMDFEMKDGVRDLQVRCAKESFVGLAFQSNLGHVLGQESACRVNFFLEDETIRKLEMVLWSLKFGRPYSSHRKRIMNSEGFGMTSFERERSNPQSTFCHSFYISLLISFQLQFLFPFLIKEPFSAYPKKRKREEER